MDSRIREALERGLNKSICKERPDAMEPVVVNRWWRMWALDLEANAREALALLDAPECTRPDRDDCHAKINTGGKCMNGFQCPPLDAPVASDARDEQYERMLEWRGIQKDAACKECGGSGVVAYSSTATWHGGIGGQIITEAVCDKCWGSGDTTRPWLDLRRLESKIIDRERKAREEIAAKHRKYEQSVDRRWAEALAKHDAELAKVREETARKCAEAVRNAIFDFGIGSHASNTYSPIMRRDMAVQLAERAIIRAVTESKKGETA